MEEEDHFTQTQLPTLIAAFAAAAIAALHFLSWFLYCTLYTLSLFALSLSWCPFIGNNGATTPALFQPRWLHMGCTILSMVGATTIDNGNPLFLG